MVGNWWVVSFMYIYWLVLCQEELSPFHASMWTLQHLFYSVTVIIFDAQIIPAVAIFGQVLSGRLL